jgi:hypothetical protein
LKKVEKEELISGVNKYKKIILDKLSELEEKARIHPQKDEVFAKIILLRLRIKNLLTP